MPILGNIKSRGELQDEVFCLQEERDFFQSRYLEQVSEIKALKQELSKSKKEIRRLRMFLMDQEASNARINMPDQIEAATPKNHNRGTFHTSTFSGSDNEDNLPLVDDDDEDCPIAEKDDASSLTADEIEDLDAQDKALEEADPQTPTKENRYGDDHEEEEEEDVRASAEKLLAWASYRSRTSASASQRSHTDQDLSSLASPSVQTKGSARVSLLGKMIETMEDEDDDDDDDDDSAVALNESSFLEEKKEGDAQDVA